MTTATPTERPTYLQPYLRAAATHGAGFGSLLWSSPQTQSARFEAITSLGALRGKSVLDIGCGRADFLNYLLSKNVRPADYIGIEAVPDLAAAAEHSVRGQVLFGKIKQASILRADFVRDPRRMFVGADVLVFSGSLNTLEDDDFYAIIRRGFEAAAEGIVFNFLSTHALAAASYLRWRRGGEVIKFAKTLSRKVERVENYLAGDCTVSIFHDEATNLQ